MAAAGRKYAQKYEADKGPYRGSGCFCNETMLADVCNREDIMLAGRQVWQEMLKRDEADHSQTSDIVMVRHA